MACHECAQCNNTKDIETGIDQIINLFQHNSEKKNLFYKSVNKNKSCNNTSYSRKGSVIAVKEVNEWRLVSKGWQNSITRTRHNLRLLVGVTVELHLLPAAFHDSCKKEIHFFESSIEFDDLRVKFFIILNFFDVIKIPSISFLYFFCMLKIWLSGISINPYWQILENSSRNVYEISVFRGLTHTDFWKTHQIFSMPNKFANKGKVITWGRYRAIYHYQFDNLSS